MIAARGVSSTIREERDPEFWGEIASHPAIAGAMMGLTPAQVVAASQREQIVPLASDNGGFFFCRMDQIGMIAELHTLYRPAGWGREVALAGKQALEWVFREFQVIVTHEVEANPRSRPPRSFGFVQAGDYQASPVGAIRARVLTRAAWECSPAHRRFVPCQ